MKYGWAGSGMVMIAIPILTSKAESDKAGESGVKRTKYLMYCTRGQRQICKARHAVYAGELTYRVLHNSEEPADRGGGRDGKADDCLQGRKTDTY